MYWDKIKCMMTFVAKNKNMEASVAGRVKIQLPSFSGIGDKIVEATNFSIRPWMRGLQHCLGPEG